MMGTADMQEDFAELAALLSKQRNRGYRRCELKRIEGRLVLVRNELDRAIEGPQRSTRHRIRARR